MTGLAGFLVGLAGTLAGRVMIALGFSLVSYVGYTAIISQIKTMIETQISSMSSTALQIFMLAGGGDVIGIILGAYTTKAVLMTVKKYMPQNPVNFTI